jgi:hypothetical protein
MPAGRFAILGEDERTIVGTESFRCAPGPMGWRYFSEIETSDPQPHRETIDIVVDAGWRIARVRLDSGSHQLLLERREDALVGRRDERPVDVAFGPDDHLDVFTPATNAITVQRLEGIAEIDVVYVLPGTLEIERVRQRYEPLGAEIVETPAGRFDADRWRFTALDSGWTADLWVAGDVVVAYPRLFTLEWYEAGASGAGPLPPA